MLLPSRNFISVGKIAKKQSEGVRFFPFTILCFESFLNDVLLKKQSLTETIENMNKKYIQAIPRILSTHVYRFMYILYIQHTTN